MPVVMCVLGHVLSCYCYKYKYFNVLFIKNIN